MIHIIFNPNSGNKSLNFKEKIKDELNKIPDSKVHITQRRNHGFDIAKEIIPSNPKMIIVIGGDGSINEVASSLINTNIPIGIIPMGSGNGLARHLQIPLDFKKALSKCLTGKPIKIDAVYFNERSFFCTAGVGFDATVAHEFAQSKSRGFLTYVSSSFKSILNYQPIEIQLEKENIQKVFSLTFANANQFGNNAYISPNSDLQDGIFEMIQIQALGLLEMIQLGAALFLKKIDKNKKVKITKSSELKIKLPIGTKMHLDGENLFITQEQNIVKIEKNALKVVI